MCGIVGVVAKYNSGLFKAHAQTFAELLFVDQLRGTDGTGVFYDVDGKAKVAKVPDTASNFLMDDLFVGVCEEAVKEGHFMIGHNRAATRGNLVWKNTHPFSEGGITLVHNGTLYRYKNLADDVEVDSHAICKHMAAYGYKNTLKEIDGAFALVWMDEEAGMLRLCRNNDRPLNLLDCGGSWIIASEKEMGEWIASRNKYNVKEAFSLEAGSVYSFKINDANHFEKEKVELYSAKSYFGNYGWKQGKSNVVPLPPAGQTTNTIHAFGTKIKFFAKRTGKPPKTGVIYDSNRKQHFLLGGISGEPNTEVRVYGELTKLMDLAEETGNLEGVIISTLIRKGNRIMYTLSEVKPATQVPAILHPHEEHRCSFCDAEIPQGQRRWRKGNVLCPTCDLSFGENPNLALQMGYC